MRQEVYQILLLACVRAVVPVCRRLYRAVPHVGQPHHGLLLVVSGCGLHLPHPLHTPCNQMVVVWRCQCDCAVASVVRCPEAHALMAALGRHMQQRHRRGAPRGVVGDHTDVGAVGDICHRAVRRQRRCSRHRRLPCGREVPFEAVLRRRHVGRHAESMGHRVVHHGLHKWALDDIDHPRPCVVIGGVGAVGVLVVGQCDHSRPGVVECVACLHAYGVGPVEGPVVGLVVAGASHGRECGIGTRTHAGGAVDAERHGGGVGYCHINSVVF